MNWFKIAQQSLLFYPWKKSPQNTSLYPQPSLVDRNGIRYYKCNLCEKNVPENEIAEFIDQKGYEKKQTQQFSYPFQYIDWRNTDKLSSELNRLYEVIKPLWNEYVSLHEQMSKFEYNTPEYNTLEEKTHTLDLSNILKVFNSSNELKELAEMINNIEKQSYGWSFRYRFLVYLAYESAFEFDNYRDFIENNRETVNDLLDMVVRYGQSFDVDVKKVVCNECKEFAQRCVSCNEPIFEEKDSFPVTWDDGDRVCRNCVEKGNFDVCDECGKADEAGDMHFLEYLEATYCDKCVQDKYRDYDYYEDQINEIAKRNPRPFKEWFKEEDRIYLPFAAEYNKIGGIDEKIIKYLEQNGCDVNAIGYQDGYCSYKGRRFRIGKFLEKIRYDNMKKIQEKFKNNPGLRKTFENRINKLFRDLLSNFSQSPYRKLTKQSDKLIVISQDPHDIAKMSTGRNWNSCMNLDRGGGKEDEVFCEVEEGGLIAYLISKDDKDIESPYARILKIKMEYR
jgi:signal recognition particle subunit SEC65